MSDQSTLPAHHHFRVTNAFQLVLDMRDAGYSLNDILWILKTIDWLEPMREAVRKSEQEQNSEHN